eukprot:TRINITY_DN3159_c0_g1_i1.p1 TRINITY_DN3159_c0_g1~~TRINITY_DN3159_c0_g1_i1.p1  ORF type:complete len:127 (-),score=7.52 TRINITY_DN3159_c0_g1_i1:157-480(-)
MACNGKKYVITDYASEGTYNFPFGCMYAKTYTYVDSGDSCPASDAGKERAVANSDVIEQVVLISDWKQMFVIPLAIVGIIGSISFLWKLFSRGFKNPIYTEIYSAEV